MKAGLGHAGGAGLLGGTTPVGGATVGAGPRQSRAWECLWDGDRVVANQDGVQRC